MRVLLSSLASWIITTVFFLDYIDTECLLPMSPHPKPHIVTICADRDFATVITLNKADKGSL